MSKRTLEQINNDLETAKQYVKQAGGRAAGVGDDSGSDKCDRAAEKIDDLKKDFGNKGK